MIAPPTAGHQSAVDSAGHGERDWGKVFISAELAASLASRGSMSTPTVHPTNTQFDDVARAAYAAYGETTGHKNFRGEPMPAYDELGTTIQNAWRAAARVAHRIGYIDAGHPDAVEL